MLRLGFILTKIYEFVFRWKKIKVKCVTKNKKYKVTNRSYVHYILKYTKNSKHKFKIKNQAPNVYNEKFKLTKTKQKAEEKYVNNKYELLRY